MAVLSDTDTPCKYCEESTDDTLPLHETAWECDNIEESGWGFMWDKCTLRDHKCNLFTLKED